MSKHRPKPNPGHTANTAHPSVQPATASNPPTEPLGLKRRHFMGTALALDAAALLAACGGGGGGGDSGGTGMSGSGSGSGSASSSASSSGSDSSSASSSGSSGSSGSSSASSSGSGSGSGSAAPTNWVVSTLAGTGANLAAIDGTGGTATFNTPYSVAVDTGGYVYVADSNFSRICKITPAGVVSTLAGTGSIGHVNGAGSMASFNIPFGVTVDTSGTVFVADTSNKLIRKISNAGLVSLYAGYLVAPGVQPTFEDTWSTIAAFNSPYGVAVDSSGNLFVAETLNHMIRKISPTGWVSILAGVTGTPGYIDGSGSTAKFYNPTGVAVDASGNVYVADKDNYLIRKISSTGIVSTLAGTHGRAGATNGTGGTAKFFIPSGVAVDNSGNVYVADNSNHRIRKISSAGLVSTLAGTGVTGSADGMGGTASFYNPTGIAIDSSGNLYVADFYNNLIRKLSLIY